MLAKPLRIDKPAAGTHTGCMDTPRHVLLAPSHPDPYPWYARLRLERPLDFDEELGLWVASDPALVRHALQHPDLRVRPPAEPVPRSLVGTPTGDVFAQLVRMNDGAFHARHRPQVIAASERWSEAAVAPAAESVTAAMAQRELVDTLLTAVPVAAMARLLGVGGDLLEATVQWVQDFAAGIAPGADAGAIGRSDEAVLALMAQGEAEGLSRVQAANRIALMQQAQDATAGLIGNAIVAWQRAPQALSGTGFVADVAARDPAVHNTRRHAAADVEIAGRRIAAGQGMVLLLVAGRLGFGAGAHACPGERIALQVAAAALRTLHATGTLAKLGPPRGYRPLANARIPVFDA